MSWVGGNGDWNTATNWSTGALPGLADDVVIGDGSSITITHSSGSNTVNSVQSQQAFTLSGGSLAVSTTFQASNTIVLSGGTFSGGTINLSGRSTLIVNSDNNNDLSGVTVNGNLDLSSQDAIVRIGGTVTLNGTMTLSGSNARLATDGDATLRTDGGGQVVFACTTGSIRQVLHNANGSLTLGPGLLVHGGFAEIGQAIFVGGNFSLTNYGTIQSDVSGQQILIDNQVNNFVNYGTVVVTNGASMNISAPTWSNIGTIITSSAGIGASGSWSNLGTLLFNVLNLSNFGRINTSGNVTLGGAVTVRWLGGYVSARSVRRILIGVGCVWAQTERHIYRIRLSDLR